MGLKGGCPLVRFCRFYLPVVKTRRQACGRDVSSAFSAEPCSLVMLLTGLCFVLPNRQELQRPNQHLFSFVSAAARYKRFNELERKSSYDYENEAAIFRWAVGERQELLLLHSLHV
mmetsp:Transcript_43648/g.64796  ORF Transcript_43648/g.64796 Transcript_43648/m.64796 type:complete len:116 (-) Transcript_43648:14-361(-)